MQMLSRERQNYCTNSTGGKALLLLILSSFLLVSSRRRIGFDFEFQFPRGVYRSGSLQRFTHNWNVLILDAELSGSVKGPRFIFLSIGVRAKVERQYAQVNFFPRC